MTWLGTNDFFTPALWQIPDAGSNEHAALVASDMLVTGSLVIETDFEADPEADRVLLEYSHHRLWQRGLSVRILPNMDIVVEIQQGPGTSRTRIRNVSPPAGNRIRLTVSWDAPRRFGITSVEYLGDPTIVQAEMTQPLPLPIADLERIVKTTGSVHVDHGVTLIAVSDRIESVGLDPSLASGTLIATDTGPRPIEQLVAGDMVLTEQSGLQPIRWILSRQVPAAGSFAPIRLRAPYLELDRDIIVAPHQRMMLHGGATEYLFGQDCVMVAAADFLGHASAQTAPGMGLITYHQIILDQHECLQLAGAWGASQFLGSFRHAFIYPVSSPLGKMPVSAIPFHIEPVRPLLQDYEANSLLSTLSA